MKRRELIGVASCLWPAILWSARPCSWPASLWAAKRQSVLPTAPEYLLFQFDEAKHSVLRVATRHQGEVYGLEAEIPRTVLQHDRDETAVILVQAMNESSMKSGNGVPLLFVPPFWRDVMSWPIVMCTREQADRICDQC